MPDQALSLTTDTHLESESEDDVSPITPAQSMAFTRTCVPAYNEVLAFVRRLSHSLAVAQDVTQTAYLKALKAWPRTSSQLADDPRAARAWLYRIASNTYMNEVRSVQFREVTNRERAHMIDDRVQDDIDISTENEYISEDVKQALSLLEIKRRHTIELHYFDGKNCEEVAKVMQIPASSVRTLLVRARSKLAPVLRTYAQDVYGLNADEPQIPTDIAFQKPLDMA